MNTDVNANLSDHGGSRRRIDRWFKPAVDGANDRSLLLEHRLLLSAGARAPEHLIAHVEQHAAHHAKPGHQQGRLTPVAEINAQYDAFLAAFNDVLDSYVASINEPSTTTVAVSSVVTAAYAAGSPTIAVADASVFGAQGTFTTPVVATATLGGLVLGKLTLTGRSGNVLAVDLSQSNPSVPLATGTVLSAIVPSSAQSSASSIFPSYITNSTIQMGISLVEYFNNVPVKLPRFNAPPHQPAPRGAIQMYVYKSVAGTASTSLQQLLLAIPLPETPGSDLDIYRASVNSAVEASRLQVIAGVQQIFASTLKISAPAPANRLGENFNSSSTSSTTTSTSPTTTGSTAGITSASGTSSTSGTTTSGGTSSGG